MPQSKSHGILDPASFVVYYGRGPVVGMEAFDLAILEPAGWSLSDRSALQAMGVTTLAYLSVLEATPGTRADAGLARDDLLVIQGAPWAIPQFGTMVVDPRSRRWQRFVYQRAMALLQAGWNGLFLDTLGDLEAPVVQGELGRLLPAAAELVHGIRACAPDAYLVQNNGVWVLLPLVVTDLDGVCWETSMELAKGGPFADAALAALTLAKNRYGVTPLLLCTPEPGQQEETLRFMHGLSRRFGFRSYVAPGTYTEAIRLPDGRTSAGH